MIRVGVAILPEVDPARDDRWARAEAYGFAHAWSFDHLAWRSMADDPWHATVPVLAAAALQTSRIQLGTFVASPNFRHPVLFSKELMTLDVMSGGRLLVGIGAGGPGFDAAVLGHPELSPKGRADRFAEFVTVLDLLLRQPVTTWSGEHYSAVEARTIPGPAQRPRPPFIVAANGPRAIRLAVSQGDGWSTHGLAPVGATGAEWWTGIAGAAERFDQIAAEHGPLPDGFRRVLDADGGPGPLSSVEQVRDDLGRAAALGFTDVVIPWPRAGEPFQGAESVLDELAPLLRPDGALDV